MPRKLHESFEPTISPALRWESDTLASGWQRAHFALPDDGHGPCRATLIRPHAPTKQRVVLYLHGFVDYFFHPHLAEAWLSAGFDFYALELRRYGRSILPADEAHRLQNYVPDISLYRQELDATLCHLALAGYQEVVLMGHSTGGLIASMWTNAHPGAISALVLNSPWLDLNENWFKRHPATVGLKVMAKLAPLAVVGKLGSHYGRALHSQTGGEWDFNLEWKPHTGFPVRAAWISSIRRAQRRVARGLNIDCPVYVATSGESGSAKVHHEGLVTTDSVLRVADMVRLAPRLGEQVILRQFPGGAHDLALSPEPVRSDFLADAVAWATQVIPPDTAPQAGAAPHPSQP